MPHEITRDGPDLLVGNHRVPPHPVGWVQGDTARRLAEDEPDAYYFLVWRHMGGDEGVCRELPERAALMGLDCGEGAAEIRAAIVETAAAELARIIGCPHRESSCNCLTKNARCAILDAAVSFSDCRDRCPLLNTETTTP